MTDPQICSAKSWCLSAKRGMQCVLLILSCSTHAQSCRDVCELYGDLLLAPERALIGTFRQLEKIAKPVLGPRNTRGRWIQRDVYLGQNAFDTTFYFKSGLVQRIEMVSTAPDAQCRSRIPWSETIEVLNAWQGKNVVKGHTDADDSVQKSVHWSADDIDVTAYWAVTAGACATKVAFKKRDVKDASAL